MTFGEALEQLKIGKRIYRKGWNGKDMWVYLMPSPFAKKFAFPIQSCLAIKTVDDKMQPGWLPSQADLLSDDWRVKNIDP